jgi:CheY-like chemotaxis protein
MDATSSYAPLRDTPIDLGRYAVLVVEDDTDHRDSVRTVLEEEGYRVEGAADGRAALDRLLSAPPPDLVLVDLMMPVMDGRQLMTEMKARPSLAEIPVVVMTGAGRRLLYAAPVAAGYLEKPISSARLLETLAASLASHRHAK